jgi:PAS domain S-box-containing protein
MSAAEIAPPATEVPARNGPAERLSDHDGFDFAFDAHLLTDQNGIILVANPPAAHLLKCSHEFLVGKPLGLLIAPPDRSAFYSLLIRDWRAGTTDILGFRIGRGGTEPREVIAVTAPMGEDRDGRPTGYRWVLRDVTDPRRMERELKWEQQLLGSVIDATDAIILVVDVGGRILRSNAFLHEVSDHGSEDLNGWDWSFALLTPEDRLAGRRLLEQALDHGSARSGPLGLKGRAGNVRSVLWSARGMPDGPEPAIVLVGHDVTELQEAQAQAVRAERLAAIGQVAAGLAHESRNAIQRGQACLSLLSLRLADRPDLVDLIDRTRRAQDDLHRLYEGVLNYAAPLRLDPVPVDLAGVWREAWANLAYTPGWGEARLVEQCAVDTRTVADQFHLRRVFRNLFENARAAVAGPLRVTITCEEAELDREPAFRVRICDNGPGFPPKGRDRLFDAFFTTKTHGTGLGLALCKRVVDEHRGRIEAGADGPGAEIILTLPRSTPC